MRVTDVVDVNSDDVARAMEWLQFIAIVLLGIIAYFLKRSLGDLEHLEDKVQKLDKSVAIILDRDRRRRLEDYLTEDRDVTNGDN